MSFKIKDNTLLIYGSKDANVIREGDELLHSFLLENVNFENLLFWAKHKQEQGHKSSIIFVIDSTPVVLAPSLWQSFIEFADDYLIEQEIYELNIA